MAKPTICPKCNKTKFNYKAKLCWICYLASDRALPKNVFKKGEKLGEKHLNWKGGKWLYWRKQCLVRDDYTCQKCGLRDEEIMDVDHIKPKRLFPELRLELNNLQSLCPNCHKRKTNLEAKRTNTH